MNVNEYQVCLCCLMITSKKDIPKVSQQRSITTNEFLSIIRVQIPQLPSRTAQNRKYESQK